MGTNLSDLLNRVHHSDCVAFMKTLPDNCIDSIVTDPPYELGFMGKSWDNTGIANSKEMRGECLRILKPGGHLLSFSGTRTYHRMACAIEDAGFEVRDMIEWVYGSGFPKSLNISKQLEKQGHTEEAKEWIGRGSAAKPAHEPICMARKPLGEKTVAENVLKWGTGGINIDESRVGTEEKLGRLNNTTSTFNARNTTPLVDNSNGLGRFPANLIHDNSEEVRECFPETKTGGSPANHPPGKYTDNGGFSKGKRVSLGDEKTSFANDSGNASRFFKSIPIETEIITCNSNQKQYTMSNLFTNNILCKNTFVSGAERLLKIIQAIKENIVLSNADDSQEEKLDRLVKNAEKNADLGEIVIALNLVAIKGKQGELVYQEVLKHFRDYTEDYKKCFQILNLVKLVEISDNTDITEITVNLLKSFGSAQSAIEENTHCENLDTDDLKGDYKSLIYQAKASKAERNKGCDELQLGEPPASARSKPAEGRSSALGEPRANNHPTVKPIALMEYLIKMVTKEGGIVFDPFTGSGTTLVAAKKNGFQYLGTEMTDEYIPIIEARLNATELEEEEIIDKGWFD